MTIESSSQSQQRNSLMRNQCEVCDLPFRTRKEIEDHIDLGLGVEELESWVLERFNFTVSQDSLVSHKDHMFLGDLYPFMHLKRPKPDPAKVQEIREKLRLAARERDYISSWQFTTEDDSQI